LVDGKKKFSPGGVVRKKKEDGDEKTTRKTRKRKKQKKNQKKKKEIEELLFTFGYFNGNHFSWPFWVVWDSTDEIIQT
jgi:hypothetical protein